MNKKHENATEIPDQNITSIAWALLPTIQELFNHKETKKEFEKWKAKNN